MSVKVSVLIIAIFLVWCSTNAAQKANSKSKSVETKEAAIAVAEEVFVRVYGKEVLKQRPFNASLSNDDWTVVGTFHCPQGNVCKGGVAQLQINKNNGEVKNVIHGK